MGSNPKERRRFSRLPVSIMIRVRSEEDAEAFVANYTHDLSHGGMFLKSLSPKPVGTPVCLQLPSPHPPGFTEVHGKVVYQNTTTVDGLLAGMGIEFVSVEDGARGVLQRFIDGTWRDIFKAMQGSSEEDMIKSIDALFGFINFMMNLIPRQPL